MQIFFLAAFGGNLKFNPFGSCAIPPTTSELCVSVVRVSAPVNWVISEILRASQCCSGQAPVLLRKMNYQPSAVEGALEGISDWNRAE